MNECKCGKPTRDEAYVCDDCLQELAKALGDMTWLDEELEITITRQKGIDYRRATGGSGAKKPSERPAPANWAASEARVHLKALLVSWALFCNAEGVRNSSPEDGLPADTIVALSRWLMWRVDGLAFHDIGPEAVDEITSAVAHCHRLIDRPADRQYLGRCQQCEEGGQLYTRPGADLARCDVCFTTVRADVLRKRLLEELDDRLCTAAEIAHLSTYLGLKADREQVRKYVEHLGRKGRIQRESAFSDQAAYRFGEVYVKLLENEQRKAVAS